LLAENASKSRKQWPNNWKKNKIAGLSTGTMNEMVLPYSLYLMLLFVDSSQKLENECY
jgi:hypothetical protein